MTNVWKRRQINHLEPGWTLDQVTADLTAARPYCFVSRESEQRFAALLDRLACVPKRRRTLLSLARCLVQHKHSRAKRRRSPAMS